MSENHQRVERRRFYRVQYAQSELPTANIFVKDGTFLPVEVINISRGGLLCYTSEADSLLAVEQKVPRIEITFPARAPIFYSGIVRRLQPARNNGRFFCAIEFTDSLPANQKNRSLAVAKKTSNLAKKPTNQTDASDLFGEFEAAILTRVFEAENYTLLMNPKEEIACRTRVYNSFRDITACLAPEEKWWFFELLDELKRKEPDYPEGLVREFLEYCRQPYCSEAITNDTN